MKKLGIVHGTSPWGFPAAPWHVVNLHAWPVSWKLPHDGNLVVVLDLTRVRPLRHWTVERLVTSADHRLQVGRLNARLDYQDTLPAVERSSTIVCWGTPINLASSMAGWGDDDLTFMRNQIPLWCGAIEEMRKKYPRSLWGGPSLAPTIKALMWGFDALRAIWECVDVLPMTMLWHRRQASQLVEQTWDGMGMPWEWTRRTCDKKVFLIRVGRSFWRGTQDAVDYRRELQLVDAHLARMAHVIGGGVWAQGLSPEQGENYQWHGSPIATLWRYPHWSNRFHRRRLARSTVVRTARAAPSGED